MTKFDPAQFGRFVGRETRRMIREKVDPLQKDVTQIKSQFMHKSLDGEDGQDGPFLPFDAERFGKAMGKLIRESVEPLEKRMAALEAGGAQKTAGRAGLAFKGEFQRALAYIEGDVVTRNDRLYVAVKDVPAGDNLRDGMEGWVLMIKGVQA